MAYFIFCVHNHQPVGNFDSVLEDAYRDSYWPFLKALSRHPSIKLTLHNSGFLFDWIGENHPEYIELLRSMVSSGQVEIMGGGYYEPVLSVIPEEDRLSQIRMMSDKFEEVFGKRPRGIWLAERVWEPLLPTTIRSAGLEYLLVDDYHFVKSGLEKRDLGGYYITEDQGNVVKIFPGSEALRYLIPFRPVEALEEHLKGLNAFLRKGDAAIYGDDGEKFGVWPGTHKWVFDEGWLDSFFEMLDRNAEWLKSVTLSEYLDMEEPLGSVYLPTTSYMEMGEWSLPAEASKEYTELVEDMKKLDNGERIRRFLQGGIWRNFFAKYPEANWMHKRMLLVSRELKKLSIEAPKRDLKEAKDFLYKAQCNDAYWHGVFGGLYLPHLRTKVYENLIRAEQSAGAGFVQDGPAIQVMDLDADSHEEVIIRTQDLGLFFSPHNGGGLYELDFRPCAANLSNTLSRWQEGYHHKLLSTGSGDLEGGTKSIHEIVKVKEKGLERYLKYDTSRRGSFLDHFLDGEASLEKFFANEYRDLGDFFQGRYEAVIDGGTLRLSREGAALGIGYSVSKEVKAIGRDSFKVNYRLRGHDKLPPGDFSFGVELNLILPCCDGPACLYKSSPPMPDEDGIGLGSSGVLKGIKGLSLLDTHIGIKAQILLSSPATLWRFPVHTVSLSEGGFERIYQGSCLLFQFPIKQENMEAGFTVKVGEIKRP
ncbi:MAG: DUF1926 domain-containing protein [Deltaproteobacteria bacterium]|nr:DUF1926 domain-containing protein [Deltaproteobacteria bacterium]